MYNVKVLKGSVDKVHRGERTENMIALSLETTEALSRMSAYIAVDAEEEIVSSGYGYALGGESPYVVTSGFSDDKIA